MIYCHPREDGDPDYNYLFYNEFLAWIPAYAGMTSY
jgi:hypothetical protein